MIIQWGIPGKDSSVEGIAQDLEVDPPNRHVSVHTLSAGQEGAREGQEEAAEGGPPGGAVGLLSVLPSSSVSLSLHELGGVQRRPQDGWPRTLLGGGPTRGQIR